MGRFRALAIALVWIAALSTGAYASEYGISTYRVGLMDLFAGYMAPPSELGIAWDAERFGI